MSSMIAFTAIDDIEGDPADSAFWQMLSVSQCAEQCIRLMQVKTIVLLTLHSLPFERAIYERYFC